jgi:acyl-CoA synthetase (AMP-forming)/AMP-acid ligase II
MTHPPTANIATPLNALAQSQPHTLALIEPHGREGLGRPRYRSRTYSELDRDTDCVARGLESVGIGRGTRTVLMVRPSLEFYVLTFALFKAGAVVVLIDPGMGVRNLGRCIADSEPAAFIGIARAHLARHLFGWGRATLRTCVSVGTCLLPGGYSLKEVYRRGAALPATRPVATGADETAAILFTSGSTGIAKGVVYTHGIFAAQVEMLRRLYDIRPGEVDLPTFPLFGLFGPALGMTAVIPEMDATRPAKVDPRKILGAITDFGVTNLFGSPALLRRVGRYGAARGIRLPTLRRVISAGAPVPWQTLDTLRQMLPEGVQIHTPYGATEALPVSSIGSDEILKETRHRTAQGAGVCIGRPVEGVEVKVIRVADEPIPTWAAELEVAPGENGEIVVRGPAVTASYYNRPRANELTKIYHADGAGHWHRMGDVGYLDSQGRLWFCGRKSQRVVTSQRTFFTVCCEGVFNAHPAVVRTALVGVLRKGTVEPVLCVETESEAKLLPEPKLRRELLALGSAHEHTQDIRTILFHKSFPVDIRHNAKIFREKLATWAARQLR